MHLNKSYDIQDMDPKTDWIEQIVSAWTGHRAFAEWLVKSGMVKTAVELGVDRGYSLFCFANAGIEKIYGIDLWEPYVPFGYDNYLPMLQSMTLEHNLQDRVELIRGEFNKVAQEWTYGRVDLIHIDGTHDYLSVKKDFETWEKFLNDDGIIIMHDVCVPHFTVKPYFNEITYPKAWFEHCYGLGVVCKKQETLDKIIAAFPNIHVGQI